MKVVVKPLAMDTIESIVQFIVNEIQMPETGKNYGRKMLEFAYSLDVNWPAYSTCHHKPWAKMGLKCATFDKKYVFAYKIIKKNVVIYFIKHGKLLY